MPTKDVCSSQQKHGVQRRLASALKTAMSKQVPATSTDTSASEPPQPLSSLEQAVAVIEEQFRAVFAPGTRRSSPIRNDPVERSN
jgi:hypothetical protein